MAVIACVLDDSDLRARLARIAAMRPATTVVESECHPDVVQAALAGKELTAVVFCQMAFPRFLEMRQAVLRCGTGGNKPRIIVAREQVDSAFVYRALSFGVDDIIDIARDDEHVAEAIDVVLSGRRRAFELYLVGEVDAQVDITLLRIDYADEVDRRIVPMIVAGYTDREIADVLHFSHQAVRNRISRILMRSGIRNRTQLASTFLLGRLEVFLHGQPEDDAQP